MPRSLDQRVRDALAPEDIIFEVDINGDWHFATDELPYRTVIDVQAIPVHSWVRIDQKKATVTIALDGKTVIYRRRGCSFNRSRWICDLESQ